MDTVGLADAEHPGVNMMRILCVAAIGLLSFFNASSQALTFFNPSSKADDCRNRTTGDICAAGSPWAAFTQFRVALRSEEHSGTTTMTMHSADDFSIDIEDAPATHGRIIVLAGRAMLMKDAQHETGYEIDALDAPVLMHQLVITLLDQAFPKGPSSVSGTIPISVVQKTRAIRIATQSADGAIQAPWTLTGTAQRAESRISYDLQLAFTADSSETKIGFTGFWEKAPLATPLDDRMSLAGWTVHWLTPMTSTSEQGTILDYGAKPAAQQWADVGALRKYIADEPARRAKRRKPADAANPGRPEHFTFEAFQVDGHQVRTLLGKKALEYRPGSDVMVEEMRDATFAKTLALDYGFSLSTMVYREPKLTGFGLSLDKEGSDCFSWEWFKHDSGDIFSKMVGRGKLRVSVAGDSKVQELVAVEFLDDIPLQCEDRRSGLTYEAVVKTGSTFRVKP